MTNRFSAPKPPPRPAQRRSKAQKEDAVATALGLFVLAPLLILLLWNYGGTELIEALGGPDANLNVVDGYLAVLFFASVCGMLSRGGFPAGE